ncbi:molybdopterin-dependent oxidoreductase [Leptolyngbya sp. 15MV]|nr:molybdopterin-dependent oxidoreductase [Leptolyngbya sp. 15MV]
MNRIGTLAMRDIAPIALFAAIAALLPIFVTQNTWLNFAVFTLIICLAAQGWNILGGYGGQYSFGHAAFFGTAAYATAILQLRYGVNPYLGFAFGIAAAAAVGWVIGALSFRSGLRGSYFALVTLAFAEVFRVLANASGFTGGAAGLLIPIDVRAANFQFAYALPYTNLSTIIGPDYKGPEELGGFFSGWEEEGKRYSVKSWQYDGVVIPSSLAEAYVELDGFAEATKRLHDAPTPKDPTLRHPRCVYQILKRHYARYTPEMVERITGCPRDLFLSVADRFARASGRERTAAICYAVGWNHHTKGAQIIRAAGILQALLGNTGRPGGGILALRGHTSIQGSTDIATLYDLLPGYLPQPHAFRPHATLEAYLELETNPTGWWHNFPKYYVSLMRAWYGAAATPANGMGHDLMARVTGDHSQLPLTVAMERGVIRGLFVMGQNPVVGGSNSKLVQRGLARLEWLVVRDVAETDTATFWRDGHLVRDGEMAPEEIGTEVFLMPASLSGEKAGSFTNIHRLVQWHDKVVDAPGDSRSELWFTYHLGRRLKALHAASDRPEDAAIQALAWDYPEDAAGEPDPEAVLREINGCTVADGKPVAGFQDLQADGSTACGCWIYSGIFPEAGRNLTRARVPDGPDGPGTHLGWGFAWPDNRRTLNNRASADPSGARGITARRCRAAPRSKSS